jgi:hypothetical protein
MSDDDSLFDRARRAVAGPTPAERAATLDDRAADDPASLSDDVDELIDLLDADDPDVVGDALGALRSLVAERPESVESAVPAVFAGLSERSASEWTGTTLGDASPSFMNDLARGGILLSVAEANPTALGPVVDDLAERYTENTLEPMTVFAFAYTIAADPERTRVDPGSVVAVVADALRDAVEPSPDDDEWGLDLQPMATAGYVDLLASFDGVVLTDDAAADRRDALEAAHEHGDEDVAAAAEAALSDG